MKHMNINHRQPWEKELYGSVLVSWIFLFRVFQKSFFIIILIQFYLWKFSYFPTKYKRFSQCPHILGINENHFGACPVPYSSFFSQEVARPSNTYQISLLNPHHSCLLTYLFPHAFLTCSSNWVFVTSSCYIWISWFSALLFPLSNWHPRP